MNITVLMLLLMNCKLFFLQNSAFLELDEQFYKAVQDESPPHCSGSTVLAALLQGSQLHVANAGDSRAVISKRGRAEELSRDHRPGLQSEYERVMQMGEHLQLTVHHFSLSPARVGAHRAQNLVFGLAQLRDSVPLSTASKSTEAHASTARPMHLLCAGGFISDGYLNGHLSVTRGIGDFHLDSLKEKKGKGQPFSGPLTAGVPSGLF